MCDDIEIRCILFDVDLMKNFCDCKLGFYEKWGVEVGDWCFVFMGGE